jgi:hypothetical protein
MVQSYCQIKARDRGVKARKPERIQQTSVLVIFYEHIEKKNLGSVQCLLPSTFISNLKIMHKVCALSKVIILQYEAH